MQANKQYPYPLSKVTRVAWRPEQGYWAIDFKDEDEDFGKFYLVNGRGKIVGEREHSGRQVLLSSDIALFLICEIGGGDKVASVVQPTDPSISRSINLFSSTLYSIGKLAYQVVHKSIYRQTHGLTLT